jgi:hypothetical protein
VTWAYRQVRSLVSWSPLDTAPVAIVPRAPRRAGRPGSIRYSIWRRWPPRVICSSGCGLPAGRAHPADSALPLHACSGPCLGFGPDYRDLGPCGSFRPFDVPKRRLDGRGCSSLPSYVCDECDLQGICPRDRRRRPWGGGSLLFGTGEPGSHGRAAVRGDDLAFLAILASSACLDTDRCIGRTRRAYAAVLGVQGLWGFCGVFGS